MRAAIVGAGFAGLAMANSLVEAGVDVTIYEEHDKVGYPPHCTGIVSQRTMRLIGKPAEASALRSYTRIFIESADGLLAIPLREPIYKLDRVKLERLMLERALSMGVRLIHGRVVRVSPTGRVELKDTSATYDSVILAEGFYGSLRNDLGVGFMGRALYGINVDYHNEVGFREIVVSFSRGSGGFFSWLVGHGDVVTAGVGASRAEILKQSIRTLESTHGLGRRISSYGGRIIIGPPGERLRNGSVHVAGDAAGLNKPLTGGGLYPNALAARLAQRMILGGAELNDALATAISGVAAKLRRQLGVSRLILTGSSAIPALLSIYRSLSGDMVPALDFDGHEEIPKRGIEGIMLSLKKKIGV